jgi:hypothetical protein
MKFFSGTLATTLVAATLVAGCGDIAHSTADVRPSIKVTPGRTIQAGERTRITANTRNLVGARAIRWNVTPNDAQIQAEAESNGQTALFGADQPGVYTVSATVDLGNGQMITDHTSVTVRPRPTVISERVIDPAQRNVPPGTPAPNTDTTIAPR